MNYIKDWVMNIAALVMFIVIIEMLIPSGKMKKYVNLVTGFVLLIAIINPVLKIVGGGLKLEDLQVSNSNYIDKLEIEKNSELLKEDQNKQIVEVYRKKIIQQLEDSINKMKGVTAVKCDVIINEDYHAENFGEIIRAYVWISTTSEDDDIKPVTRIKKISIGNNPTENKEDESIDKSLKKQLEKSINEIYGIKSDRIIISNLKE